MITAACVQHVCKIPCGFLPGCMWDVCWLVVGFTLLDDNICLPDVCAIAIVFAVGFMLPVFDFMLDVCGLYVGSMLDFCGCL